MRATPPSRRMSAGTRSSAITAAATASSATFACSGVTTSMITPPLSISARPVLTLNVASSRMLLSLSIEYNRSYSTCRRRSGDLQKTEQLWLLQPKRLDAVVVLRGVLRVHAVGERLDD